MASTEAWSGGPARGGRATLDVYKVYDLFVMIFFLERAGGAPAERLPPRIHLNRRPVNRQLLGEHRGPSIS